MQTGRASTLELVLDADKDKMDTFYDFAGTEKTISAPLRVVDDKPVGLLNFDLGQGVTFVFASANMLVGAPTEGDTDGIVTYTVPITLKPLTAETDYIFGFVGDLTS